MIIYTHVYIKKYSFSVFNIFKFSNVCKPLHRWWRRLLPARKDFFRRLTIATCCTLYYILTRKKIIIIKTFFFIIIFLLNFFSSFISLLLLLSLQIRKHAVEIRTCYYYYCISRCISYRLYIYYIRIRVCVYK